MKNEVSVSRPLTNMQKEFARLHVENSFGEGGLSNTECAVKAGYSPICLSGSILFFLLKSSFKSPIYLTTCGHILGFRFS